MKTSTRNPSHLVAAQAQADQGNWAAAADLIRADETDRWILNKRLFWLSLAKRYDEALALAQKLAERSPGDARSRYMAGYQLYAQDRYRAAIPWFRKALAIRPDYIKALWRLANCYQKLGELSRAQIQAGKLVRAWHQLSAEEQDQDRKLLARAYHLLAKAQMRRDPLGAAELAKHSVIHDGSDPYNHYLLGKALIRAGRASDAIGPLQTSSNLKRNDVSISSELARAFVRCGEGDEAIRTLRQVEKRANGWFAFNCGRVALEARDASLARELLLRASRDRDSGGHPQVLAALLEADRLVLEGTLAEQASRRVVFVVGGRHTRGRTASLQTHLHARKGLLWTSDVVTARRHV